MFGGRVCAADPRPALNAYRKVTLWPERPPCRAFSARALDCVVATIAMPVTAPGAWPRAAPRLRALLLAAQLAEPNANKTLLSDEAH